MVKFELTTIGDVLAAGFKPHEMQCAEWHDTDPATPCYAVYRDDVIIAMGSDIKMWEGRYILWFIAGTEIKTGDWAPMLKLFSVAVASRPDIRRLEINVACDYVAAIRMALIIGFKLEGKMISYMPNGGDAYLYAWVRK